MHSRLLLAVALLFGHLVPGQDLKPFDLSAEWLHKIEELAPEVPSAKPGPDRRILVFSLHTGFEHWAIPHTEAVVKTLATKSGMAECYLSKDIRDFESDRLKEFDAVVLNNTCPERDYRDIFYDVFRKVPELSESERNDRAARLEKNLIGFVANGGGLVLLHGGTTMQIYSPEFSTMVGGSFDFHPKQQPIRVKLAEPDHVLLKAFKGEGFTYTDEPYFFKNAYEQKDFRPLLYMETTELEGLDRTFEDTVRYIAWIKPHGKGRVFVCAPSHNAQSFENPDLLEFLMDGVQYAIGDLAADDRTEHPQNRD